MRRSTWVTQQLHCGLRRRYRSQPVACRRAASAGRSYTSRPLKAAARASLTARSCMSKEGKPWMGSRDRIHSQLPLAACRRTALALAGSPTAASGPPLLWTPATTLLSLGCNGGAHARDCHHSVGDALHEGIETRAHATSCGALCGSEFLTMDANFYGPMAAEGNFSDYPRELLRPRCGRREF